MTANESIASSVVLCNELSKCVKIGQRGKAKEIWTMLKTYVMSLALAKEATHETINGYERISNRGSVWKLFLRASNVQPSVYVLLLEKKQCPLKYKQIRNDSFRTFGSFPTFFDIVPEVAIIRLLNSFEHLHGSKDLSYRQGMNQLAGVLLYVMPEVDAFFCFGNIINSTILMWLPTLDGVHAGCKLVDLILQLLDAELYFYLKKKGLTCELYGFAIIMSLSSCVPPFNELLSLWDVLITTGMQWNVVAVAAQVFLQRDNILKMNKPNEILNYRKWPELKASLIVPKMNEIIAFLPETVKNDIELHVTDVTVCQRLKELKL